MTKTRKIGLAAAGLLFLALVSLGAYIGYYALGDRALPGTHIGTTDVSGMTQTDIKQRLELAAATHTVTVSGNGVNTTKAKISDMGFSIDSEELSQKALDHKNTWSKYFTAPFESFTITPEVQMDKRAAGEFAVKLTEGTDKAVAPINPSIEFQEDKFAIKSGTDGYGVDALDLKKPAIKLLSTLKDVNFTPEISAIPPSLKEEDLHEQLEAANELIAPEVTITLNDSTVTATPADKASWVDLSGNTPQFKDDAIKAWVTAQGESFKVEGVTGVRYVSSSGETLKIAKEAIASVAVDNADSVAAEIISNLKELKATNTAFTTATGKLQWEEKKIAKGAENLRYMAAEGEKWLDADLSRNRVRAYEGATLIYDLPFIDGAPATPTITGQFKVYAKLPIQDMSGDGYVVEDVPWIMYFSGGYGFHGSSAWRSGWGFDAGANGSHGCLNMRDSDAKTLYDWAPQGTVVVSHY